jgi:hypothetical protein
LVLLSVVSAWDMAGLFLSNDAGPSPTTACASNA